MVGQVRVHWVSFRHALSFAASVTIGPQTLAVNVRTLGLAELRLLEEFNSFRQLSNILSFIGMNPNEPPRPKGTQGQPPDKQEVAKAMNLAFYQFKLIYLAARDVLPPSTYELSHFDVISHQLLDTATEELRKKFTEAPYSTALAISWAPREFLYRAWRTGRRSRSMKRRDQVSDSQYSATKTIDAAMLSKHSGTAAMGTQNPATAKQVNSKDDWLSVVLG
ncbi:hypothetical protein BDZ91DRAFT_720151 [Kalaharituber pfeilii]|nr:hypothetical protein BDZ91DRAFT_720151 [Kalaharituber pfeilii]